jgi:hypothetical protein
MSRLILLLLAVKVSAAQLIGPDVASLKPEALVEYAAQPGTRQQLFRAALALTEKNLGYLFGSAEPARGGMDCSGTIHYVLRQFGWKDVPRDSTGQFQWLRAAGTLRTPDASFSTKKLTPGDLLFWTGTYDTAPAGRISHVMLYLGTEKATGKPVMWGSSDGRPYGGRKRYGVSVFEFRLPKPESKSRFVGYGALPAR